jgi:uncharacterized protein
MLTRLSNILKTHSFFLFGARGTGKSSLLKQHFQANNVTSPEEQVIWIDLLQAKQERDFALNPDRLSEITKDLKPGSWVIIDEVQKVPRLLDVVHREIEENKLLFALTGSSARKLKRGGANLLAGRAFVYHLFPLTHRELGESFNLASALRWGTLPGLLELSSDREKELFLDSYVHTYFREEIIAEQLIRAIDPFRRFLEVSGQCSGTILNYRKIADDIRSNEKTVKNYFDILEDTLLGFYLPAFHVSIRKQQKTAPKFYLFDPGIKRSLDNLTTVPVTSSAEYGLAFEHFIICEMKRLSSYLGKNYRFYYLATKGGLEVDLAIERPGAASILVEIKSTDQVQPRHLAHLTSLKADCPQYEAYCFCQEVTPRRVDGVRVIHWMDGFKEIGL